MARRYKPRYEQDMYAPVPRTAQRPKPREKDPRTLAREIFGDGTQGFIANTAGLEADAREPYIDLIESQGWHEALRTVVVPMIRKVRLELVHKFNLDEAGRQRDVGFLFYLGTVLHGIYDKAGVEMPVELKKEFN